MESGNRIRVLLVDDDVRVRQTLNSILKPYSNIEVVGEASDGDEAVTSVGMLRPAVVVMDISMNDYNTDAMGRAGAVGVYLKSMALEDLYPAIKAAHATI
jgi:CheY-like chemotaxis protein